MGIWAAGPAWAGAQELRASDLIGARGLSLSANLALAPSNDGIFTNAAGLAAKARYSIEGSYLLDRIGSETDAQFIGGSVVDSQTSATAMGFAYTRLASGSYPGSTYHLALAAPLTQGLYVGATGKYLVLNGPESEEIRAVTADAGLFWQIGSIFSVGAAGYNLIPVGHKSQAPLGFGVGVGVGSDQSIQLAADWRADFGGENKKLRNAYSIGAEYLASASVPVRASLIKDERIDGKFWAVGIGYITTSNVAVDVAYRQDFDNSDRRTFAVNVKLFLQAQSSAASQ